MKRAETTRLVSVSLALTMLCGAVSLAAPVPDDGRVGKIVDVQGNAGIRPATQSRWTPVEPWMLAMPGDWIRTDPRGANALRIRLAGGGELTLGPGALVELAGKETMRVAAGELEAVPPDGGKLTLTDPDGSETIVARKGVFRTEGRRLTAPPQEPKWLAGFKGAIPKESMGELVAMVDGRAVPLTIGFHKVTVDVRDQIARTVIEESFVNHTEAQLEGTFHFPLPPGASISNFGMWIGDELVEADVVEKQRAREIYETILREKRDPGLLEWSEGNIFKARVFPIFPNSEKKVTITYTQVLPMVRGQFRYSYPLASEMLKANPLASLEIDFKVSSARAVKGIRCPTHPARLEHTEHSAHAQFSAQEFTPESDFEAVVELDPAGPELVVVPHRRGEDGYFLAFLTLRPPAEAASGRALLPDGQPLDLVIIADTSRSMDRAMRQTQAAFISALLSSLGEEDTFTLLACDTACRPMQEGRLAATGDNVDAALAALERVESLGWTSLEIALTEAFKRASPGSQVLYVGDGIATAGDGDSAALAARLRKLHAATTTTCHAVGTGNRVDAAMLATIASLGGGSVRGVGAERGPAGTASDLLAELLNPTLREAAATFSGFQAARIYPEILPNVPEGTQQILAGRYLPGAGSVKGTMTVKGKLAGRAVEYSAAFVLPEERAGDDGSYIPRLWARMHLDRLLQQGETSGIKDEIVGLSEEYRIMTPYTSFLVLESDADRERFGVKRRFRMKDGEKFFAKGRDDASFELLRQQMQKAADWRFRLRSLVTQQIRTMGRDVAYLQNRAGQGQYGQYGPQAFGWGGDNGLVGGAGGGAGDSWGEYDKRGNLSLDGKDYLLETFEEEEVTGDLLRPSGQAEGKEDVARELGRDDPGRPDLLSVDESSVLPVSEPMPAEGQWAYDADVHAASAPMPMEAMAGESLKQEAVAVTRVSAAESPMDYEWEDSELSMGKKKARSLEAYRSPASISGYYGYGRLGGKGVPGFASTLSLGVLGSKALDPAGYSGVDAYPGNAYNQYWFHVLFPYLGRPAEKDAEAAAKPTGWPGKAGELAKGLCQAESFPAMKNGLLVEGMAKNFSALRKVETSRTESIYLFTPRQWVTVTWGDNQQTLINWADGKERAAASRTYQCGMRRNAVPDDTALPPFDPGNGVFYPLDRYYGEGDYSVEVEDAGKDLAVVVVAWKSVPDSKTRFLIDTARNVLAATEQWMSGELTSRTEYLDYAQVEGFLLPARIESRDKEGRPTTSWEYRYSPLSKADFDRRFQLETAVRKDALMLEDPIPTRRQALESARKGKSTVEANVSLFLAALGTQQFGKAFLHLEAVEKLAAGKPGLRWIRQEALKAAGRNEELRQSLLAAGKELAQGSSGDALFLAQQLVQAGSSAQQQAEMLELLDVVKPIFEKAPPRTGAMRQWKTDRKYQLQALGRSLEARRLDEEIAREYPQASDVQYGFAYNLGNEGEYEKAIAWIDRVIEKGGPWESWEEDTLRSCRVQLLEDSGQIDQAADYLRQWTQAEPVSTTCYQQLLSVLVRTGKPDELATRMAEWLALAQPGQELTPARIAKVQAAVSLALGQGYSIYTNRIMREYLPDLARILGLALAKGTAGHAQYPAAWQIENHHEFGASDEAKALRRTLIAKLEKEGKGLPPESVQRIVSWLLKVHDGSEQAAWKRLARLFEEWWAALAPEPRKPLAGAIDEVLWTYGDPAERVRFLRRQLKEGAEKDKDGHALQLYYVLVSGAWSEKVEKEVFDLIGTLYSKSPAKDRPALRAASVMAAVDQMLVARRTALRKEVKEWQGLSRTARTALVKEHSEKARKGLLAQLDLLAQRGGELAPWYRIEALHLRILLGQDRDLVEKECWSFAESGAGKPEAADDWLSEALLARHLGLLEYLATRNLADPKMADRLAQLCAKGAKAALDPLPWRLREFRLLLVLDRNKELLARLTAWSAEKGADPLWSTALGYLLAEQNRVAEAVALFEKVEAADELSSEERGTLADWYAALGQKEKRKAALLSRMAGWNEYEINSWLQGKIYGGRGYRGMAQAAATQVEEDVLLAFEMLFNKAVSPSNYFWLLTEFFRLTRDFRLVGTLIEGLLGLTPQQIYMVLEQHWQVSEAITDEASVQTVIDQVEAARKGATAGLDRRALDLIELIVRSKAATLKNQPGPHIKAAAAAMARAFKGEWALGERRLMAHFLESLGTMSDPSLAATRLQQMTALHSQEQPGSEDRLAVAGSLAAVLWTMEKKDAAIDLLETELAAFRKALGEELQLPDSARTVLSTLTRFLQDRSRFADAEKHLKTELALVRSNQGKQFLLGELAGVYDAALNAGGTTSLGKGAELYAGARTMMIGWFKTAPRRSLYSPVGWICNLMGTAHRKGLPGVQKDLLAFAAEALAVSKFGESYEAHGIQSTVAASIRTIIGPARAIEFIIEAIEQEPAWYRWQNQGGYAYHVYSLGNWRADAGKLGPLEKRLEKVVLAALEEDLVSLYNRGCGSMTYECSDNVYWKEKREFFARTAEKVARENQGSPAIVEFAATYLHDGIKENARAIALLTGNLLKEGKLSPNARSLLGKWLVEAKRFKEAVPILEALVEKNPGMMSPRYDLMIAWAQLKQEAKLVALVAATEKYLRDDGLWAEGAIAGLALACQHALLHEQAATYFREAIAEHRRTRPAGGSGDGTLSDHYRRLAESLTVLGRTDEALEAGCGAVVSWGSSLVEGRRTALAGLNATLAKEKDLGTVVARLDSQVEQSGRENAVLRKAVGQVLLDRGKCDQAVMQLEKALEAQPYDLDSYDALVKAHECANDETAVVATMLRKAEVATRDLELFEKVARRMSRTARAGEAERAFTTIVEALPAESESHGALAVIREEQGRYPEAIEQWRHVVRIRSKEPPGYLSLAKALIHEKGWEEARSMLKTLLDGQWPAHFGDVKAEAATLLKKIPKKK